MRFEWDESKRIANLAKHRLDFADAPLIFEGKMVVALDERIDYGEDRWIGIGVLLNRIAVVVYTLPDADIVRIISLRKALSHERAKYQQAIEDGLGEGGQDA